MRRGSDAAPPAWSALWSRVARGRGMSSLIVLRQTEADGAGRAVARLAARLARGPAALKVLMRPTEVAIAITPRPTLYNVRNGPGRTRCGPVCGRSGVGPRVGGRIREVRIRPDEAGGQRGRMARLSGWDLSRVLVGSLGGRCLDMSLRVLRRGSRWLA